jgi:hypothetical protein
VTGLISVPCDKLFVTGRLKKCGVTTEHHKQKGCKKVSAEASGFQANPIPLSSGKGTAVVVTA